MIDFEKREFMSKDSIDIMENLLNTIKILSPEDIPNIDLYMDQVTTFMEEHLGSLKRFEDDKILTKTMINNYAKNDLLPPPEKKKYSKDHVLILTFIYYFKSFLSINDIKTLTSQLTDKYFQSKDDIDLEKIYNEILKYVPSMKEAFKIDVEQKEQFAKNCFEGTNEDNQYLNNFILISLLGIDLYMKKQLIESLIDTFSVPGSEKELEKERNAKEKKSKEKNA